MPAWIADRNWERVIVLDDGRRLLVNSTGVSVLGNPDYTKKWLMQWDEVADTLGVKREEWFSHDPNQPLEDDGQPV